LVIACWNQSAYGQTVEQYAGTWSGIFHCAGKQSGITIVLQPQSGYALTGTLSFYPLPGRSDVVAGSHGIRMQVKGQELLGGYGAWIQRPKNQRKQLGFTGRVTSLSKLSLTITSPDCKPFEVVKYDGDPNDSGAPRVVTKEIANSPQMPQLSPAQKAASARRFVGRWEGPGFCLNGPATFELRVLPALDQNGFNATLTVVQQAAVQADDISVRGLLVYDDDVRFPVRFEPDPNAKMPPRQKPIGFLGRTVPGGKLGGESREAGCGTVQLNRVSQDPDAKPKEKTVPDVFAQFEGAWDGAIYDKDNRARQVAFVVSRSEGGSRNRVFDVAVVLDGTEGKVAFSRNQGDGLSIVNILNTGSLPVALRGPITSKIMKSGSVEYFVFATQGDADGVGLVWRRPQSRAATSLQMACKDRITPFASARDRARDTARDLRIEFFPALSSYDENDGALRDAYVSVLANASDNEIAEFGQLAAECMVASPGFYNYFGRNLLAGIVDMVAVEKMRIGLIRNRELRNGWIIGAETLPSSSIIDDTYQAENELASLLPSLSVAENIDAVLAGLQGNVKTLQRVRPSILKKALEPVSIQLARLGDTAARVAIADRRARAGARWPSGSPMPPELGDRSALFGELMSGVKDRFSGDEISLFGGFVAGAIDKCSQPSSLSDRLQLLGFLFQGVDRALFGDSYATGSLSDTLRESLQGSLTYDEGAGIVAKFGCDSQFLAAALADLVDASRTRLITGDGRASLFVRSCALDRSVEQCKCMARTMQSVIPGINDLRFDRSQLATLASQNPLTAAQVGAVCGVGNY